MSLLRRSIPALLLIVCVAVHPVAAQQGRQPVPAENGMVVSTQYVASEVGRDILKQGGNAIDAAVATAFALAVVHPAAGNIGGGGFLVYHGADGETTAFNFREKAPAAAFETMFLDEEGNLDETKHHRALTSTGVPGTVAGLALAHERFGSLPWSDLLQPAVRLAENGFPFTWNLKSVQERFRSMAEDNPIYQSTADAFLKNGTETHEPGELLVQGDLAETLKRIRDHGRDGFYKGETARLIAEFMSTWGGLITEADLAAYEADEQAPIHGTYRGYDIYSMSPPSSGGIAIVTMLNILEAYDLASLGHNSANYLHLLTEAMRRAFADRAQYVGDPKFNPDLPVDWLISKEHAADLRSTINPYKASASDENAFNALQPYESEETTHFSVVDADGNTVSLTYTLEFGYGNSIVVEGAGFLLNNEMGDFNPMPGVTDRDGHIGTKPNLVEPGKRMISSMTPTIVAKDGRPVMAIGSPGGRTIINTSLQVVLNVIDHNMNIARAIEAPRIHHQWLPDRTAFERGYISADTQRMYEMLGHTVYFRTGQGSAMGIWIDWETGIKYGSADSRSYNGRASGY
ncbi:MAG: gamma-glutamyltransferase [Rhodothermales bacterium]|nr:gamma-glutamyltransferase [Rhodothermales bacterium]MDG2017514.1 gamma-glutamyltransferase [Rhodothermales bacterium]